MTGLTSTEPAGTETELPTLAALRAARASRVAALRRRATPIRMAVVLVLGFALLRSHPHPGFQGSPLVITVAACCFVASMTALFQLVGGLLLPRPSRTAMIRTLPLVLVLLVASSVTLEWLQSSNTGTIGLYAVVACVTRVYPRRISRVVFGACLAYFLIFTIVGWDSTGTGHSGFPGLADVIAILAVYGMSLFANRIRAQERQEEQLIAELDESRAGELRAVALAERQRLAREMHDVLAHSLSGLVLQLEGARLLAASAPDDPRLPEAVDRAHQLAKSGLDEARQAIAMLRDDDLPGPDRLADLTEAFTADTGVPCRFAQAGPSRELSSAVRLALYRVTQEALTNVRKHAHPGQVAVRLEYRTDTVTLTVEDSSEEPGGAGTVTAAEALASQTLPGGYGLTGMRERAELLGGTVTAGPTATGFCVRLEVPA